MTRIKTAGWVMHKCSLDSYKFWTHTSHNINCSDYLGQCRDQSEVLVGAALLQLPLFLLCFPSISWCSTVKSNHFCYREQKQVTSLSCWSNKPLLYFLFLKIINKGNGVPQETRNINNKMLSISSIIKNKYELYKGRFQVKGRRDSGTKQKREIDQTFHLCGLRNKTSLFALQSHSNVQKLANTMFNDKVSLLTQLSNVLEQNIY